MKKLTFLFFIAIATVSACKKSDSGSPGLNGKWESIASAISTGAGNTPWTVIPKKQRTTLTFNENGSISGSDQFQSYTIKDSITIVFKTKNNEEYPHYYKLEDNVLVLNSLACIEGCSIKYTKQ